MLLQIVIIIETHVENNMERESGWQEYYTELEERVEVTWTHMSRDRKVEYMAQAVGLKQAELGEVWLLANKQRRRQWVQQGKAQLMRAVQQ